jgi:vacuolar-type H+-ATPase subunit D/Vma8
MEDKLQATHSAESLKLLIAPVVDKEVTMALSNAVSRVVTHTIDEARKALEHQRRVISVGNKVEPIRNVSVRAWHMLELVLSGKTVYAAADAVNVSHNDAVATVKSAIATVVCFVNATNVDPSLGDELRDTSRSISNLRDDKRARELWVSTLSRLRELGVVVSPARKVISHHEGNQP